MHTTGPISGSPAFPATGTFRVKIVSTGELCAVTAVSGNDFTITRQDGGSSLSGTVLAGATIEQVLTKEALAAAFLRADQATAAVVSAQGFQASGVGQFSTPGRFLGVLSVQGPPTSGTYQLGDYGFDSKGAQWYCSAGGSPGTWLWIGGGLYHAEVWQNVAQSIPSGTPTAIAFDTIEADPNSNFTTGAGAKYTCPVPGRYQVVGALEWSGGGPGSNQSLSVYRNGSEAKRGLQLGSTFTNINGAPIVRCAAGDTLQVMASQGSGVAVNTTAAQAVTYAQFDYRGS